MIGSFPIGSVPVGSNQLQGIQFEILGVAESTATGLSSGFNVKPVLDLATAEAQGEFSKFLSKLGLTPATATTSSIDVITKTILKPVFAHAIASGESLDNLQIRVKIGRADADADSLLLIPKSSFEIGQAGADSQANNMNIGLGAMRANADAIGKLFNLKLGIDKANATAQAIDGIPKSLPILDVAELTADSNILSQKIFIGTSTADSEATGIGLGMGVSTLTGEAQSQAGDIHLLVKPLLDNAELTANSNVVVLKVSIDVGIANSTAEARGFGMGVSTLLANAQAEGVDIKLLIKTLLETAELTAQGTIPGLTIEIDDYNALASALDADVVYLVQDVPDIVVNRTSTQAVLKVLNQNENNIRIFRADDHRGLFSVIQSNWDDATDYTDSGLDETKNYKYVACFVVVGTKGGQEYIVTGQKSLPVYTIGNQLL